MNRLSQIKLIRQEDADGCLVACMAMVTGKTYAEVKAAFPRENVAERGLIHYHMFDFLSGEGFAFSWFQKYRWSGADKEREVWPMEFTAEAAICGVDAGRGGENSHGIVALRDGRVLDPAHGERRWNDYQKFGYVMPLWDVRDR